jgi:hypothetical protein
MIHQRVGGSVFRCEGSQYPLTHSGACSRVILWDRTYGRIEKPLLDAKRENLITLELKMDNFGAESHNLELTERHVRRPGSRDTSRRLWNFHQ